MSLNPEIWQGALAGLVFGFVNFWLLTRIVRGMVQADKVKPWKTFLSFIAKMALLAVTIGLILKKGYVSPLPFLGGFTASLVAAISVKAVRNTPNQESGE